MQNDNRARRKIKVSIMNTDYTIVSDNDDMYVIDVASDVDKTISSISKENPSFTNIMATTLACLDYCDRLAQEKKDSENLRKQIRDYISETTALKKENDKLKADNQKLRGAVMKLVNEKKKRNRGSHIEEEKVLDEKQENKEAKSTKKKEKVEKESSEVKEGIKSEKSTENKSTEKSQKEKFLENEIIKTIISNDEEVETNLKESDYMKFFEE